MTTTSKNIAGKDVSDEDLKLESLIKNSSIMMVDDEPINMDVLQIHLREEGYSNFIATSDSTEALEKIKQEKPDIVLLDLMMPDVDGFQILEQIRHTDDIKHMSVVVLTSSNDPETKLRALRLGANDFLSKPVDASELALRLRNTLSAQSYQNQLANFDPLTGLPNRKKFALDLSTMREKLLEKGSKAALLLINIDRFKSVNDSLGRDGGDEVLLLISQQLRLYFGGEVSSVNPANTGTLHRTYRVGGDKFVVLLNGVESSQDIFVSLAPFLEKMGKPFRLRGNELLISCSVGTAIFPNSESNEAQIYGNAETAMFQAKHERSNSHAHYSLDMDEVARRQISLENGLRHAVENQELFLTYQPKVGVNDGCVVAAEALVRWQHPELGLVSPEQFIPLAEDSGLIVPIGEWILNEACQFAVKIRELGFYDFKIAVNISIRQVYEESFTQTIRKALASSGLAADGLKIELTENMIMENAEENVAKLLELKSVGIAISIDDFGTGYSSLSYLQKFPLDELKIDQSFVKTITSALQPAPIVKAVVSLAHDLGMTVVAEGVETTHQLARLKALKCEEYQGYLCSRPLVAEEFTTFILAQRQQSDAA